MDILTAAELQNLANQFAAAPRQVFYAMLHRDEGELGDREPPPKPPPKRPEPYGTLSTLQHRLHRDPIGSRYNIR